MGKRGQVTVFVIIAIFLVIGVVLILYTQTDILGKRLERVPGVAAIKSEIQNCLDTTALEGIRAIGLQGGYTFLPNLTFSTNLSSIAYSYYEGKKTLISISSMADEINKYVSLMLPKCVDFTKWPDFDVGFKTITSNTIIQNNLVKIDIKWPVTLTKETTYSLDSFTTTIPIRLGLIYNITNTIVNGEIKDPTLIDIGYLVIVKNAYGMNIDLVPYNTTIIYSITDPLSKFGNSYINYTFFFANKFK